MSNTVGEFFQSDDDGVAKSYMRERYDVKVFCSTPVSPVLSPLARIHNNFVNAVKEEKLFPKDIVVVLDADIIKMVHHPNLGISEIFGQLLKNLLVGIHHEILAHKEKLHIRSKRSNYPTVLWSMTPLHSKFPGSWNQHRKKFNVCFEKVAALYPEMGTLKLLKF